ncbi:MAG: DVU_1556 family methyltransferase [Desulfobacterales bacterium]
MTAMAAPALYESPALQAVTGPALRPGGLELTRRALSFCNLPAGARVADIGCGTGVTAGYLRENCQLESVGVDCSFNLLGQARRRNTGLPLIGARATHLPFGNRRLSGLICECVLSLVEDGAAAWREFARVLAPGGLLVLADVYARVPEHAADLASLPATCCLKGAASRAELVDRMHRSGFTLLVWEDHSHALKLLAARWVFAGGSLGAFWGATDDGAAAETHRTAICRTRPGYFLAVARKENAP